MVVIICADVPMVDGDKSLHLDKLKSDLASAREAQGSVQNMTVTRNNTANRAFKVTWKPVFCRLTGPGRSMCKILCHFEHLCSKGLLYKFVSNLISIRFGFWLIGCLSGWIQLCLFMESLLSV